MKIEPKQRLSRRATLMCRDESDRVLLVREGDDPYWILPGGRLDENETFAMACIREIKEELNLIVRLEDLKFRFCFENFFKTDENQIHEICISFDLKIKTSDVDLQFLELGRPRQIRWWNADELTNVPMQPLGLHSLLTDPIVERYKVFGINTIA